jgi:YfiH family protein
MDMTKLPELEFIPFAFPGVPHVRCAFQIRRQPSGQTDAYTDNIAFAVGPEERAIANRRAIAPGLKINAWAAMHQVHGVDISFHPPPSLPERADTAQLDGLATRQRNFGLLVKSADCQPLLLADSKGEHIAALHVGWRGNRANFPGKGVYEFCSHYKLAPKNIYAVRGPSLGRGAAEFRDFDAVWSAPFMPWFERESRTMDLWGITSHQLIQAGIPAEHIYSLDLCTYTLKDRFFSFRAGAEGRQASLIWLED